jgi:hypothetical protein
MKGALAMRGYPCWCDSGENVLPERRYRQAFGQSLASAPAAGSPTKQTASSSSASTGCHARLRAVGKTTDLEEALLLYACFREFKYMVIVSTNCWPLVI